MQPGTLIGHYEVIAPVGAGGMGEVYRARRSKNITLKYCESGHMMYLRDEDRVALRDNLIAFIDNGLRQR